MPEGHVIHRLAWQINNHFAEQFVQVSSPQGRFSQQARWLDQSRLVNAQACGKHLFIEFETPEPNFIHIHLGLIGKIWVRPIAPVKGQIRLRISNGEFVADLAGPQWCNLVFAEQVAEIIDQQGKSDPQRPDADASQGWEKIRNSARPIADLLLNQTISSGVGNIYRAEVLFRNRIDPMCPGNKLKISSWQAIWSDLVLLMDAGSKTNRIDTVLPEHEPEVMGREPRIDPHGGEVYVYRRSGQNCLVCGSEIKVKVLYGRNLFWCASCQKSH